MNNHDLKQYYAKLLFIFAGTFKIIFHGVMTDNRHVSTINRRGYPQLIWLFLASDIRLTLCFTDSLVPAMDINRG